MMRAVSILGSVLLAATFVQGPASALPLSNAPEAGAGLVHRVSGCHRDTEYHWVSEFGRSAWHYHRGASCRPIEVDAPPPPPQQPADCHRDVRRHFVPEYGRRITHRHVGPNCRIQEYEQVGPGDRPPSEFCVSLDGVTFCLRD
jgi:hypothetical protein